MRTSDNGAFYCSLRSTIGDRVDSLKENMMDHQHSETHNRYEIRLKGNLPTDWSPWFNGLTMTYDDEGNTLLSGAITDQAALHSYLDRARDLGLTLLEVRRVSSVDVDKG